MIQFTIPLKTINPLNGAQGRSRGAVFAKAARRKKERNTARLVTCVSFEKDDLRYWGRPPVITMTRLSAGTLDTDGLQAALKSVRDGIADALGTGDGPTGPLFECKQKKCKRGEFGVEVTIT